ncbi:hypothetical protein ABZP36_019490 [Zizania latifolia]
MEIPCSQRDMARGAEVEDDDGEEYDRVFYEEIEAPKFVDLSAPDAARPTDDPSWFCLRIGTVMAARSPNVRVQKAISRRNQSSMRKCPHSAPPKPPRTRIVRLSTATEAAEKAAKPKLKTHRICALRASPTLTKAAKVEASSARKNALTTPRSKAVWPRQDPFFSAKHQKESVAAAKTGTVVKALFMSTPKKDASQTPAKSRAPPLSEVCSKLRKLNLACREVPSRYLCQSSNRKTPMKCDQAVAKSDKTGQESRPDAKKKILGRSVKHANTDEAGKENLIGRENPAADDNPCAENASSNEEMNKVIQEPGNEVEIVRAENYDVDKENMSYVDQTTKQRVMSSHFEGENLQQLENNENVPHKSEGCNDKWRNSWEVTESFQSGIINKKCQDNKWFHGTSSDWRGEADLISENLHTPSSHCLTEGRDNCFIVSSKDANMYLLRRTRYLNGRTSI